ncbi:hypothetical protein WJX81_006054 [Elliptochloris bilobata]|uniref:Cytochrome P450 n=1 Tax=Elliptochloris bilobata TaxID=381761 RepID=A0AAW1RG17_9CHLO
MKHFSQRSDHHRALQRWAAEYGGIYRIRLVDTTMIVVSDPHLVEIVLARGSEVEKSVEAIYSRLNIINNLKNLPTMFSSKHTSAHWKAVRKGVSPAFNQNNIRRAAPTHSLWCALAAFLAPDNVLVVGECHRRRLHPIITGAVEQLMAILRALPNQALDMEDATHRLTLDLIMQWSYNVDFKGVASFGADAEKIGNGTRDAGAVERGQGASKADYSGFQKVMRQLVAANQAAERGPGDASVAGHLLRTRDAAGKPLSDEQLVCEFGVMFQGGHDTTARTMAWALYMVANHPEVERRVTAELDALGLLATPTRPSPRQLEYDDISKLQYLTNCIKESLRMRPPDCVGQNLARHSMPAALAMLFSHFTFRLADEMGGVEGMTASEDIGRLAFARRPAHGLCTFWRPRLDLSGMKALHPGRGLLMHCTPRV